MTILKIFKQFRSYWQSSFFSIRKKWANSRRVWNLLASWHTWKSVVGAVTPQGTVPSSHWSLQDVGDTYWHRKMTRTPVSSYKYHWNIQHSRTFKIFLYEIFRAKPCKLRTSVLFIWFLFFISILETIYTLPSCSLINSR